MHGKGRSARVSVESDGRVLLPKRWIVERSFAWAARFRRLARDYERLETTLKGLHYIAFATLMSARLIHTAATTSEQPLYCPLAESRVERDISAWPNYDGSWLSGNAGSPVGLRTAEFHLQRRRS